MSRRRRYLRAFYGTLAGAATILTGIYVLGGQVGSPAADVANAFVSPQGSDVAAGCVWHASPVAPPTDPATWCRTPTKAYTLWPGATAADVMLGGSTSPVNFPGVEIINGTKQGVGNPGCRVTHVSDLPPVDIFNFDGCITFRPQLQRQVNVSALTCNCDYARFKDFNAADADLTVSGSINLQDSECAGQSANTDIVLQNINAAQLGIFGGVNNIYASNIDISDRRNDASQWFSCASGNNIYIPSNVQVEDSRFHDNHLTHHQGCANNAGFNFTPATLTAANAPGGILVGGTSYGYTVRMMERAVGNTLGACLFPQATIALPAGATACAGAPCNAVSLTWTNPNPAFKYCAGWQVYGRSTTQSAERRILDRTPATFTDPDRCTAAADYTWLDDGTAPNLSVAVPANTADVHNEAIHIQAIKNLLFRRNKFWNDAEYNISISNPSTGGCGCNLIGPIKFEQNSFGAPSGENDVPNGPGVIQTVQWDSIGQFFTGTFTNASTSVTALSPNTATVPAGATVVSQDACITIPANTTVTTVNTATSITLSAAVTVNSTGTPAQCTTNPRTVVTFLASSGSLVVDFNTFDGPTPWLMPTNNYGFPTGAHVYGNLAGFNYTSAFFCNADKNQVGMTLEYEVTVGTGIACGTGSIMLATQPTNNVSNGTSSTDLHLVNCASGAQNLVSTSIADGYPGADFEGDPRPNGGGTGTKLDAGQDEKCA